MLKALLIGCIAPLLLMALFLWFWVVFEDREALELGGEPLVAQIEEEMGHSELNAR
jgi:hypothetical protein